MTTRLLLFFFLVLGAGYAADAEACSGGPHSYRNILPSERILAQKNVFAFIGTIEAVTPEQKGKEIQMTRPGFYLGGNVHKVRFKVERRLYGMPMRDGVESVLAGFGNFAGGCGQMVRKGERGVFAVSFDSTVDPILISRLSFGGVASESVSVKAWVR